MAETAPFPASLNLSWPVRNPEKAEPRPPERAAAWGGPWPPLLIAAAVGCAYADSLSGPLVLDDIPSIADNPTIRHLGSAFWAPALTTGGGRPVLNLSLALNHAISGTAVWSYHAVNLAIHLLAGWALFGIVRRTLAPRAGARAAPIALAVALLWVLHPLQTESVTYIVQRAESLMGLFYLLALYGFIRGAASGSRRWYAFSFAACLLGMGTKEVMVSAPLVIFLYDRTFLAGSFRAAWRRRRGVHAALASTWLVLAALVLSTHGRGGTAGYGGPVSWWAYAATQVPAVAHYLRLCLWPSPLIFDYGTALVTPSVRLLPSALLVAGLLGATLWALARRPALGFLGCCFFAILAPSSSVVPVATETMAEHRMYLPLIPVLVLAVLGIYRWLGRAAPAACLVLAAGWGAMTWQRNTVYRTGERLWSATVAQRPDNDRARVNLGNALEAMGHTANAVAQYEQALQLRPDNVDAHNDLGNALQAEGQAEEANAQFREALRLRPDGAEAHNNLGNVLHAEGRKAEAVAQFEASVRLNPGNAEALNNLGNVLNEEGRTAEAIARFEQAAQFEPDNPEVHNNLGNALNAQGRTAEAVAQLEEALRLNPDYAAAHNDLGNALNAEGRTAEAIAQYEAALRLAPDMAGFHLNLAVTLLRAPGRAAEAVPHLQAVLRLQPENPLARQILSRMGAPER